VYSVAVTREVGIDGSSLMLLDANYHCVGRCCMKGNGNDGLVILLILGLQGVVQGCDA